MSYSQFKIVEGHVGETFNIDCTDPNEVYVFLQSLVGRTFHVESFRKQMSRREYQTLWKQDVNNNITTLGLDEWIAQEERLADGE